ncbi:MAG: hypothetical protein P8L36_06190 [SAR324 cluster bacterium]|nr:hypothetical protein [SAR324 cluster bacterium]
MKKKRKSVLKLKNFTLEKFQLWKDMEGQIKETLGKYGVQLDNIVYDEEKHTKSFTVLYDTTEKLHRALISTAQFLSENGLTHGNPYKVMNSMLVPPTDYESALDISKTMIPPHQNVLAAELVSLKDSEHNITDFSMHKAKKLIDKAEISLEKLKSL